MNDYFRRIVKWIFLGVPKVYVHTTVTQVKTGERLKDRRIIVTGGNRGIGFSIAKRCTEEGANVLITGRDEKALLNASKELGDIPYLKLDMQNEISAFRSFIEEAEKLMGGKIDSLVNNAGISLHEPSFCEVSENGFDVQFSTNLKGPYFMSQEFIRTHLNSGKELNVLFVTSERGMYCDVLPYGLTKAAINSLIEGLALSYVTNHIRVNGIAPGVTVSDMTGYKRDDNLYREMACGKRVYLPEEIAEVAVFLLSKESSCINGLIVPCNQGNHLRSDYKSKMFN